MAVKIIRSPRYPIIGLPEAIERVTKVYRADGRNKIPKSLVAEHIGYQGLNGKSLGIIAAISKYGLLEGGIESMWVTPRAVAIIEREADDLERIAAIRDAASQVDLYKELAEQFPFKASDAAIRSFLITKRDFLPESAERLIRSFRETNELVDALPDAYDSAVALSEEPPLMETQKAGAGQLIYPSVSSQAPVNGRRAVFDLSEGEVVITFPNELSPESVSDLQDYLNVFMKKARREAGANEQ